MTTPDTDAAAVERQRAQWREAKRKQRSGRKRKPRRSTDPMILAGWVRRGRLYYPPRKA